MPPAASHPLTSKALYSRLLGYVRPYKLAFIVSALCMVVSAATEPLFPAMMQPMTEGKFTQSGQLWLVPAIIVAIFVLKGILSFISDYTMAWVANHVVEDMRNAMFARLIRLPAHYFVNQSSGVLMSKIAYDVSNVAVAASSAITTLLQDSLKVIALIGFLLWLEWRLTLIVFCLVPVIGLVVKVFSGRLRLQSTRSQEAMGGIMHVLDESIGAYKVVKIFGGQPYEQKRFANVNAYQRGVHMRGTIAAAAQGPIIHLAAAIALAVVVWVALAQVGDNKSIAGVLAGFLAAMMLLLPAVKRLADVNAPIQRGLAAAASVFALLDEEEEQDTGTATLEQVRGEVRFEAVGFRYPEGARAALADVSFTMQPGETVALVGASGSGKTTIANLLPRFNTPQAGRILVDGQDYTTLTLASLRANIALVSQDVVLFNDTIAANIAYGVMAAVDRSRIIAAAQAAHALEFIEALPQGFDTPVGENGVKLSGGQRQRLAIARALLKDAPILILDEATSALDTESERAVQIALEALMRHRTTLVIAHRLSTIERADKIIVLSQGRIIESGRHTELLAANGTYTRLHHLQHHEELSSARNILHSFEE